MMTKRFALALLAALAVAFRSRVRPHPFGRVLFHRHL
jgi:hypothetical protein